jgi:hypothetical protein
VCWLLKFAAWQRQALANIVDHLENSGRNLVSQRIFAEKCGKMGSESGLRRILSLIIELMTQVFR